MKKIIRLNENQLLTLVKNILSEQLSPSSNYFKNDNQSFYDKYLKNINDGVYTNFDKTYDYKLLKGVWFAKNKNGVKWVDLTNNPKAITILHGKIKDYIDKLKTKDTTNNKSKKNVDFLKGFQLWMNKTHKGWYNNSIIPTNKTGVMDNITKSSYAKFKTDYINELKSKNSGPSWSSWANILAVLSSPLFPAFSPIKKGLKSYFRKLFPNVAELFFARDLSTDDFTGPQKTIIMSTINNAIKRTGKTTYGSVEYVDYGGGIEKEWFGPGGTKSSDMILNTLFANPKFMVATTLGRFSYKKVGDKFYVTDIYDFKKIDDIKTTPKELEGLSYPEKIWKIKNDNNVGYYLSIRQLGYLEHPDDGLNNKPKINIELNQSDYA
jgi:hypothetical protein